MPVGSIWISAADSLLLRINEKRKGPFFIFHYTWTSAASVGVLCACLGVIVLFHGLFIFLLYLILFAKICYYFGIIKLFNYFFLI